MTLRDRRDEITAMIRTLRVPGTKNNGPITDAREAIGAINVSSSLHSLTLPYLQAVYQIGRFIGFWACF